MNNAPRTMRDALDFFHRHGSEAVDIYPYQPIDPSKDEMVGDSDSSVTIARSILPLYAACVLGYSTPLVVAVAKACELCPVNIDQYIQIQGENDSGKNQCHLIDTQDFVKRVVEACYLATQHEKWALEDLKRLLRSENTIFRLAAISLGIKGVDGYCALEEDLDNIRRYLPDSLEDRPGFDDHIKNMHDYIFHTEKLSHLPNGSCVDFIKKTGSLHPTVLRKTFVSGFWESLIKSATHPTLSVHKDVLENLVRYFPIEAGVVLKSLHFGATSFSENRNGCTDLFNNVDKWLDESGRADIKDSVSYQIGVLTTAVTDDETIRFCDDEDEISEFFGSKRLEDSFEQLRLLGDGLFEAVMHDQLSMKAEHIGYTHFCVWHVLGTFEPVAQNVDPITLGCYLSHMAEASRTLFPEGWEHIDNYKKWIVDPISQVIPKLIKDSGGEVEYLPLKTADDDIKDTLSKWGLDVRKLGVTRPQTLKDRFSSDLGL